MVKSIGIDSVATNLSWSFISSQKGRFEIVNYYLFTNSHTVELDRKSKKTILPGTYTSKKVSNKKKRISLPVTNNNSSSSQLSRFFSVYCWLDSLKKSIDFFFKVLALKPKLAVKRIPPSSRGFCHEETKVTKPI